MANIRRARRSGFVSRGGRQVRESLWVSIAGTSTIIGGPSGSALLNVSSAGLLALRPFTVVRIRGSLHLESDQVAAAEEQGCAIGSCVVSDQAVAIGITAIPTPVVDRGSDLWFAYVSLLSSNDAGTFGGLGQVQFKDYDSRAMRKVEEGQTVVQVLDSEIAGLSLGIAVRHVGRMLIKLH